MDANQRKPNGSNGRRTPPSYQGQTPQYGVQPPSGGSGRAPGAGDPQPQPDPWQTPPDHPTPRRTPRRRRRTLPWEHLENWLNERRSGRRPARRQPPAWMRPRKRFLGIGCLPLLIPALMVLLALGLYFFVPGRTNVLVIGLDASPDGFSPSRSDTLILTTFLPQKGTMGMLSIPRDLWVTIPGIGENRINTSYFYAEALQYGNGPTRTMATVESNFGVDVDYYVRIRFEDVREIVNALGGVDIVLEEPMAGYPAGRHHLSGNKALRFARERLYADDFYRMQQGQILIKAILKEMIRPRAWPRLPAVLVAISRSITTDVPVWLWPRLGLTALRAGPDGIDNRRITREMVSNYITDQGADVLLPDWSRINPLLLELFGQ